MKTLLLQTKQRNEMILITNEIRHIVRESTIQEGQCILFVPHTTAAITINENADPDVKRDILYGLELALPNRPEYLHYEGNSDAHIKSSLIGVTQTILIHQGELVLGTWQGIYFCEFDGPRQRQLIIQVIGK